MKSTSVRAEGFKGSDPLNSEISMCRVPRCAGSAEDMRLRADMRRNTLRYCALRVIEKTLQPRQDLYSKLLMI